MTNDRFRNRIKGLMRRTPSGVRVTKITNTVVRTASSNAVRGGLLVGRGASNLAREAAEGVIQAVDEIGGEAQAFVKDAVIGVMEGTGQVAVVTAPAVREVVIGAVRGSRGVVGDLERAGRDAVEGAIVGAASVGVDAVEAVSAASQGAIDAVQDAGGTMEDAAKATVGGVIAGVTRAGGDVMSASRDTARRLVATSAVSGDDDITIARVAESAVEAAIREIESGTAISAETINAVATGAVEAAYQIDLNLGNRVREVVLASLLTPSRTLAPDLERKVNEVANRLTIELPKGRAAWRGRAIYRAGRQLFSVGGIDLAASLAYFTILSFFPLIALVIMVFAIFSDPDAIRDRLSETLVYYFPASQELLQEAISHLFDASLAVGIIAVVGIIFGANGLFMASNRAVNRVFDIDTRKVFDTTITEVIIATLVVIVFLASIGVTALFQTFISFGQGIAQLDGAISVLFVMVTGVISTLLPAILTAVVFTIVYYHLPNVKVEWSNAAFGAMIAVIMFEVGKHVFFWFTSLATQRSVVYGPLASVVVLLMWAYVAGLIFLYGAAIVKVAGELRPTRTRDPMN